MGYKVLGFVVWNGTRLYIKSRYGDTPKKVGAALLVAGGIGLAVFAQRQLAGDD
jgi:hypothetical protein